MLNDATLTDIIKSFREKTKARLRLNQQEMASRIMTQFKKLSKEELITHAIENVYCYRLYDRLDTPLYQFLVYPQISASLQDHLGRQLPRFYEETKAINEDGFNLMTYLEFTLSNYDESSIYWCSYPKISYDIMEEANTYDFTIIRFDRERYEKNLYFHGSLHPLIHALNFTWMSQYKEKSYDNTFRKAAYTTNELLGSTWDHINVLSTLKYEGAFNTGSILFVKDYSAKVLLHLEKPVPLSEYRQIRKLLQMSRTGHYLLVDSNYLAIGFGIVESVNGIYRLDFLDHLNWKLYLDNEEFLSCTNLLPQVPSIGNNIIKLREELRQTFRDIDYDEASILQIIEVANFQRKGTMIVITADAGTEAERLKSSAIKITPIKFMRSQLNLVTGIDGALIVDTMGYCHAVGTILDGEVMENGDPSRGARYNSALRYINRQRLYKTPCLIAVVSEDRYIDILSTTSVL